MRPIAPPGGSSRFTACVALLVLSALMAGCAAPKATSSDTELPFDEAVAQATDGLVAQTQQMPAFLTKVDKLNKRPVVLDPMLDSTSGQQTVATVLLQTRVTERLAAKHEQFEVLPF